MINIEWYGASGTIRFLVAGLDGVPLAWGESPIPTTHRSALQCLEFGLRALNDAKRAPRRIWVNEYTDFLGGFVNKTPEEAEATASHMRNRVRVVEFVEVVK